VKTDLQLLICVLNALRDSKKTVSDNYCVSSAVALDLYSGRTLFESRSVLRQCSCQEVGERVDGVRSLNITKLTVDRGSLNNRKTHHWTVKTPESDGWKSSDVQQEVGPWLSSS
jgi:hypothetical protein